MHNYKISYQNFIIQLPIFVGSQNYMFQLPIKKKIGCYFQLPTFIFLATNFFQQPKYYVLAINFCFTGQLLFLSYQHYKFRYQHFICSYQNLLRAKILFFNYQFLLAAKILLLSYQNKMLPNNKFSYQHYIFSVPKLLIKLLSLLLFLAKLLVLATKSCYYIIFP